VLRSSRSRSSVVDERSCNACSVAPVTTGGSEFEKR
jgi:hypothetical protein